MIKLKNIVECYHRDSTDRLACDRCKRVRIYKVSFKGQVIASVTSYDLLDAAAAVNDFFDGFFALTGKSMEIEGRKIACSTIHLIRDDFDWASLEYGPESDSNHYKKNG